MRRVILVVMMLILMGGMVSAAGVDFQKAQSLARNWAGILRTRFDEPIFIRADRGREIIRDGITVAYVFPFVPRGFVVIPADDLLPAIKFYTTSFDFNAHPDAQRFQESIFNDLRNLIRGIRDKTINGQTFFSPANKETWDTARLNARTIWADEAETTEIKPLLTTRWTQYGAENLKCPVVDVNNRRAPAGCVAIAYAQVMKYFEWPSQGRGANRYYDPWCNQTLTADFNHPYDWENMLDFYQYDQDGTPAQLEAVSTLVYDVAVALEMGFSVKFSSVNDMIRFEQLAYYFDYGPEMRLINKFPYRDDEWAGIIKTYLQNGCPMIFCIDNFKYGHKVVVDGYRKVGNIEQFHINFGWHGLDDGFYALDNITEFTDIIGQDLVLGFVPPNYRYIQAPPNIQVRAYINRSLLWKEYHLIITWDESPTGNQNLDKYLIYRRNAYTGRDKELIAEVSAAQENRWRLITPTLNTWKYEYTVIAVDPQGNTSKTPSWHKIAQAPQE